MPSLPAMTSSKSNPGPSPAKMGTTWRSVVQYLGRPYVLIGVLLCVLLLALVVVPLLSLIHTTFTVSPNDLRRIRDATVGEFTLFHWADVLKSRALLHLPLKNTLVVGVGTALLAVLLGTSLAWVVTRTDIPFPGVISTLALFPYILPSWAFAVSWLEIFQNHSVNRPMGVLQYHFGWEAPKWIVFGPVPIIIVLALHYYPFIFLLMSSALRTMDSQLEESAEVLGSSRWTILRRVSFPVVLPALLSGVVLSFSRTIGSFATPALLGGPQRYFVLSSQIFSLMRMGRTAQAFVLCIVLIAIASLLVWLNSRLIGRRSFVLISGKGTFRRLVPLGKYRWPLAAGIFLFLAAILVAPIILVAYSSFMANAGDYSPANFTLEYWIGAGSVHAEGEPGVLRNPQVWSGAYNTIRLGVIGGVLCGLLGLLVGYVVVRDRGVLAAIIDRLSFVPMLVPSIAFGALFLSIFSVPRWFIPSLYGTFAILVLATLGSQLPYSSRTGISSMHQIGKEMEEAALIQGASWLRRFRTILFPLARPGFVAGSTIVMISIMRELSLFILLLTPETRVLTALTFTYAEIGLPQLSNALMTFLIVVTVALTGLLKWWEQRVSVRGLK